MMTRRNGPFANLTAALVQDDEGYLWVGVSGGAALVRFRPSEMDRVAADPFHEVQYALYDASDGLKGEIARQQGRALARPRRGRPALVRLRDHHRDVRSPAAAEKPAPRRPPHRRRLGGWPPDRGRAEPASARGRTEPCNRLDREQLERRFETALPLPSRGLRSGVGIRRARDERVCTAQLPSGDYRFKVSATYDGIWTDGESWVFSVAAPFYLSAWFVSLGGVATIALVATAWWLRVRAIRQRYVLVFAERALVSRELHDTLLQSLAAINIELETALRQLKPHQTAAVDTLHRLQRQAAHSLKEARDLVVALRRTKLSRAPGLIETLRDIADHTTLARATQRQPVGRWRGEALFRRCRAAAAAHLSGGHQQRHRPRRRQRDPDRPRFPWRRRRGPRRRQRSRVRGRCPCRDRARQGTPGICSGCTRGPSASGAR